LLIEKKNMNTNPDDVIALLIADPHLGHRVPAARAEEPDWFAAMGRYVNQLCDLKRRCGCPVICAGDIFDRWDNPSELVNWAITNLPKMIAIPGQHDLPHHSLEDAHKSSYKTLIHAGNIDTLIGVNKIHLHENDMTLHLFPWGVKRQQSTYCCHSFLHLDEGHRLSGSIQKCKSG
jgi:DNA repair exonuclease SbcCD nuclease subunit